MTEQLKSEIERIKWMEEREAGRFLRERDALPLSGYEKRDRDKARVKQAVAWLRELAPEKLAEATA